jgi:AraC-like DNA-binding protein
MNSGAEKTDTSSAAPLDARHEALARSIEGWTKGEADCTTPIQNLTFFRRPVPTQPNVCLVAPSVLIVVQGAKRMLMGCDAHRYDRHRFLITSLELPASSQVIEASPDKPCLGLMLKLDLGLMAELIVQGGLPPPPSQRADTGMGIGAITPLILEPFARLLALLDEPAAIPMLGPLIQREIHYRLLTSDQAARLWQIASVGSQPQRIAKAIDWLKVNYALPLRIDELAARVQMSPSSLRQHFRQLTAMSPLEYQKWLRLNEARRLMLNENLAAASAAFEVGYASASQFSREYRRLFGTPPKHHVSRLRPRAETADRPA